MAYARLKPYNPKRGYLLQRYTVKGVRFERFDHWYPVPDDLANYLAKVRQVSGNDDTPLAFDIARDERERDAFGDDKDEAQAKLTPATSNTFLTDDLKSEPLDEPSEVPAQEEAPKPKRRRRARRK